ncbi:MAG: alpha/beta fold hydrolase [Alphaproteobacteria bacterium]|nr:alpha/beta fold hydrolase [Alphaproteobacteria bacterium]MBV9064033.1 alpha/beta fold hydrolase [Alphaproteobacteria bacterium]
MDDSSFTTVIPPTPESGLGLGSWMRELVEVARATLATPRYPDDLPRGNGETVLLIPGFLAGDWTMHALRDFLHHHGYRVEFAGVMLNLGPTHGFVPYLESVVERLHAGTGAPIVLVGQSLGGAFARALAHRHPEKIAHVVTLASPIRFPVATPMEVFARLLAPLHGPDIAALTEEIGRAPPVPVTALYSREDGIVDWRCCLQEESHTCRNIEVAGAHSAMGFNPEAQAAIAHALANVPSGKIRRAAG